MVWVLFNGLSTASLWRNLLCCLAVAEAINCGGILTGSTRGLPSVKGFPSGEVVFLINLPSFVALQASTCPSDFDTYVRFYDSDSREICSNDNSSICSPQSDLFCSIAPGVYSVLLEGAGTAEGSYSVEMTCSGNYYSFFFIVIHFLG